MTSSSAPGSRGPYRKGRLRREELVTAGIQAFTLRGTALTLQDVADVAGVSREAVRHYFPTVPDLLLAMQARHDGDITRDGSDLALPERLSVTLREAYADRGSAALTALLTASAVIEAEGVIGQAMRARTVRLREQLAVAVRQAQRQGVFRADIDGATLAQLLLAAAQGLAAQELVVGDGGPQIAAAQDALVRLFTSTR